jgi:hypothetical protein
MIDVMKILLAGTHSSALRRFLNDLDDIEIVDAVGLGRSAVAAARTLAPDIVVVAVGQPPDWALTTSHDLAAGSPGWTVVALVDRWKQEIVGRALRGGAHYVVTHSASGRALCDELLDARRAHLERATTVPADGPPAPGSVVAVFSAKGGSDARRWRPTWRLVWPAQARRAWRWSLPSISTPRTTSWTRSTTTYWTILTSCERSSSKDRVTLQSSRRRQQPGQARLSTLPA